MKRLVRLIKLSIIGGLATFVRLWMNGVRFHPYSRVDVAGEVCFGQGAKIGPGCILGAGESAKIVIGPGVWMYRDIEIRTEVGRVEIGEGTTLQKNVTINGDVSIGCGCIIAPNVFISSGKHIFDYKPELPIRKQEAIYRREVGVFSMAVVIGDDCWLGINTVIMPGVTVGNGAIIGANSVVTKNVPSYAVAVGVPAKVIGGRMNRNLS